MKNWQLMTSAFLSLAAMSLMLAAIITPVWISYQKGSSVGLFTSCIHGKCRPNTGGGSKFDSGIKTTAIISIVSFVVCLLGSVCHVMGGIRKISKIVRWSGVVVLLSGILQLAGVGVFIGFTKLSHEKVVTTLVELPYGYSFAVAMFAGIFAICAGIMAIVASKNSEKEVYNNFEINLRNGGEDNKTTLLPTEPLIPK